MTLQLGGGVELVNDDLAKELTDLASNSTSPQTITKLDAIEQARARINRNVKDSTVLDALASTLRRR